MSATAKLFMHGRSQAVHLPKEFRFEGTLHPAGNSHEASVFFQTGETRWPSRFRF